MKNIIGWIVGIIVIWFIFSSFGNIGKYEGMTAEEWFNEYDASEVQVQDLKDALQQANSNIEDANYVIDNAKSYEGASYDDMVDALNSLDTLDTVDEPY